MTTTVTTHDIEANGTTYILEWTHDDDGNGYIAITETCDADVECKLEPRNPGWYCTTHKIWQSVTQLDDGHCENYGICDSHETYDFKEIQ